MTRTGLILDDRYQLAEPIAAGGVGQVWRAADLLLDREVAVKLLRPEYADHPDTLERFRAVMEYVNGPSLAASAWCTGTSSRATSWSALTAW